MSSDLLMWIAVCPLGNFRAAYCPPLDCLISPLGKNLKKRKNNLPPELEILVLGSRTGIPYSYYIGEFPFSKFFPPADYEFPCVFLGGIPYKSSDCLIAVTDSYIPASPNCRIPYIYALPRIARIAGLPVDSHDCLRIP